MPERFKVVCIPCKALYKCSDLPFLLYLSVNSMELCIGYDGTEQLWFKCCAFTASAAEYCDWETFNVSCQADEVMAVGRARYGRMTLGRCVTTNYGSIGCGADVTPYMDSECSGRRACALNVITLSQLPLQTDKPCPPDFKYYLEATYECLKGTV